MRRIVTATCLILTLPLVGYAQEPALQLSACLADHTSGRDRKDLARWVFFAMAAHPEIKDYLAPTAPPAREQADKVTGSLFTRLLSDSCASQTKAAVQQGGPQAVQAAFTTFGQLAMQELMTNPDVAAAMGAIEKHIDQQKLIQALGGK
jgi:hypothetical protein